MASHKKTPYPKFQKIPQHIRIKPSTSKDNYVNSDLESQAPFSSVIFTYSAKSPLKSSPSPFPHTQSTISRNEFVSVYNRLMALQVRIPSSIGSIGFTKQSTGGGNVMTMMKTTKRKCNYKRLSCGVSVRSSLETAGPVEVVVGQVTEVCKDTFWPIVGAAGDKPVVLDMYTQWCGPCKAIAPKYKELSEKYLDVIFLKLDCHQENRPLAKELGLRVLPTFKIFKDGKAVKEVTGAKIENLVNAIDTVKST